MSANTVNLSSPTTDGRVVQFVPKARSKCGRHEARDVPAGSPRSKAGISDVRLGQTLILAARGAEAEGDMRLAEHLVEVAHAIFDGR
jgi:hypothetical protein